jgi:hypothetical protein
MSDFETKSGKGFSAVRTITIRGLHGHSAKPAQKVRPAGDIEGFTGFRGEAAAAAAFKKRDPFLDPEKGKEKERHIMILPFQPRLMKAT